MIKQVALELMASSGAFTPFRLACAGDVLILMYHRFGYADDGVTVSPEVFSRQVEYLTAHYRLAPVSTVAEYLRAGEKPPRGLAVITVDDGYADFYEVAYPIIRRAGGTATVFLVTEFVSQNTWMPADRPMFLSAAAPSGRYRVAVGGEKLELALDDAASRGAAAHRINMALLTIPHDERAEAITCLAAELGVDLPARPPREFGALEWDQVREMAAGGIEFGSHTATHAMLTQVSEDRIRAEVADSRACIEGELGFAAEVFAYPNGDMNEQVRQAVIDAGYLGAGCSERGFNDQTVDPFAMRRIYADTDMPHFVQTTSGFEQFKHWLRNAGRG